MINRDRITLIGKYPAVVDAMRDTLARMEKEAYGSKRESTIRISIQEVEKEPEIIHTIHERSFKNITEPYSFFDEKAVKTRKRTKKRSHKRR